MTDAIRSPRPGAVAEADLATGRVLVVEDEPGIAGFVRRGLLFEGFAVDVAADGRTGLAKIRDEPPDLVVLDIMLPGLDGIELTKRVRAAEQAEGRAPVPILMLTARDAVPDRVTGLNAGADDYLVKPFHFEELAARVQALLRRAGGWSQPVLKCGELSLDTRTQSVAMAGAPVELTSFEYRILEIMMLRAGEVISKADLTERLYEQDFERDSNVIEVFIGRLRKKLDPDGTRHPIETLRGRGYRLALARTD